VRDSEFYDEALTRLHETGPEFEGRLSNHGPMVVEAMVRRGHGDEVEPWLNWYMSRLDSLPASSAGITEANCMDALGDPSRLSDWITYFNHRLDDRPWGDVLSQWWPRLLPGLAASATHSVIRVGHAVQALRAEGPRQVRVEELAQALAYWAARWLAIPFTPGAPGSMNVAGALAKLPRLADDDEAFPELVSRLDSLDEWPTAMAQLRSAVDAEDARHLLMDIVAEAVLYYGSRTRGDEIMLVHAATAPNAVLRVLPSLPVDQWLASQQAAWIATAAVVTMYDGTIPTSASRPAPVRSADDTFALAVEHKDEHVIKFADTALDVYAWTSNEAVLAATHRAAAEIAPTE
jgi:hypothetical protein